MPFRTAVVRELCTECRGIASTSCRRCATPLCVAHAPGPELACAACEDQFALRVAGLAKGPSTAMIYVGWLLLVWVVVGTLMATVNVMVVVTMPVLDIIGAAFVYGHSQTRARRRLATHARHRKRFLAEGKGARPLLSSSAERKAAYKSELIRLEAA